MKQKFASIILAFVLATLLPLPVKAAESLMPVGKIIGLQLKDGTVTVAAYDDTLGGKARDAGLKIGDVIEKVDGETVTSAEEVRSALDRCGEAVCLELRRSGKPVTVTLSPQRSQGHAKLGVYLRQGIAGIGTVTFFDPGTGTFGALGHGVSSARGTLLSMKEGFAYNAQVEDVKRGVSGQPGQLRGVADGEHTFGVLRKNTAQGVFGSASTFCQGEMLPLADYEDIHAGPASIRSTVSGTTPKEYSVEIVKVYPEAREDGRNFLLKVTDPELLAVTGGIVQGMSGSPILQDGKFVGAVTHVLVGDAAVGYGIYIGNMLQAAA